MDDTVTRRTALRGIVLAGGTVALAGCAESADDTDEDGQTTPEFIEVEDPPDHVYVPTHREAMVHLDPIEEGDVAIAPMLTYPHPFWIVAGDGEDAVERSDPDEGHGVHLMFTVWDRETDVVLPVDDGAEIRVERDGESVGSPLSPWTMISQEMGFHFGDNVALPGDGTYEVELTLPPLSTRRTGALADRLEEPVTVEFEFEYDEEYRQTVLDGIEYFDEEHWGRAGALEPMDHENNHDDHSDHDHAEHGDDHGDHDHHAVPVSQLPAIDAYPGTILREPEATAVPDDHDDLPSSHDARVAVTLLDSDHRLGDDDRYLLVSPRTPYNAIPLADASLSVTLERDGEEVTTLDLEQTIDGTHDLHYGASVDDIESGDIVEVSFGSPPQVARHQGYETAFLEMPPVEFEVPPLDD